MYLKLKKITSIKMDSATLLDGLWPLENEGLGTAVVEEHERERFEWHEPPLVGAEVIDGLPEGVSIEGEDWITIQLGQSSMTNGTWGLQFREAFADPLVSNEDLTPLYESLSEIQEDVARNIEGSLLDGVKHDPNEDFDVDDLMGILEELGCEGISSIPTGPPILPEIPKEQQAPSPGPSCASDSGIESTFSDSWALDPMTVTVDEGIENRGERSVAFESGESYQTIDFEELQLMYLDEVVREYDEPLPSGKNTFRAEQNCQQLQKEREAVASSPSRSPTCSSSSSFSGDSTPDSISGFSPVAQFHSYAMKPEAAKEEKSKKGGRKRKNNDEDAITLKKSKKKEQNKTAAQRYRMKKKMESGTVTQEEQGEERRNKELKAQVSALEAEIKYLKDLMTEFQKHKASRP